MALTLLMADHTANNVGRCRDYRKIKQSRPASSGGCRYRSIEKGSIAIYWCTTSEPHRPDSFRGQRSGPSYLTYWLSDDSIRIIKCDDREFNSSISSARPESCRLHIYARYCCYCEVIPQSACASNGATEHPVTRKPCTCMLLDWVDVSL